MIHVNNSRTHFEFIHKVYNTNLFKDTYLSFKATIALIISLKLCIMTNEIQTILMKYASSYNESMT